MIPSESYKVKDQNSDEIQDDTSLSSLFSGSKNKMLVSIGSGVSMIKVNP